MKNVPELRCLVTGATGFIGLHIVETLLSRGHLVTALCRDKDRAHAIKSTRGWDDRLNIVCTQIENCPTDLMIKLAEHDRIIHLAWSQLDNFNKPEHVSKILPEHLVFLHNLLKHGARHLLCAGTCLEYGLQDGALSEEIPPRPVTTYGQAKDLLRQALVPLCQEFGVALCWPRLFYLYGEGQSPNALLPQLDRAISNHAETFNMSRGLQKRDYLPVERAADILARLAAGGDDVGIVNVGSGEPVTVLALVRKHLQKRGRKIELNLGHYPYPDYEPMEFWADTTKLNDLLKAAMSRDCHPLSDSKKKEHA